MEISNTFLHPRAVIAGGLFFSLTVIFAKLGVESPDCRVGTRQVDVGLETGDVIVRAVASLLRLREVSVVPDAGGVVLRFYEKIDQSRRSLQN